MGSVRRGKFKCHDLFPAPVWKRLSYDVGNDGSGRLALLADLGAKPIRNSIRRQSFPRYAGCGELLQNVGLEFFRRGAGRIYQAIPAGKTDDPIVLAVPAHLSKARCAPLSGETAFDPRSDLGRRLGNESHSSGRDFSGAIGDDRRCTARMEKTSHHYCDESRRGLRLRRLSHARHREQQRNQAASAIFCAFSTASSIAPTM